MSRSVQVSALDSRPDFIRELLNVFDNNEQAALAQNDYRRGSPTFQSLSIGCFYALALATTMSNWLFGSARGWAVFLYFAIPLPMPASESPTLIHEIDGLHQFPEWALLIVVGIHVGAAIIHLLVYRDRVMQRMWLSSQTMTRLSFGLLSSFAASISRASTWMVSSRSCAVSKIFPLSARSLLLS
ncbi:Prokaryotic cytochrome b561 [Afipia felis]|uniref:Prokaryotic cytochrome b561 n=1 Tax=Afipia felis TaxID=1035 RepID=A0A090MHE0_AFIFE|nr:cytochrome b/b6 domain-containing protein [Afipia felis]CEG06996.1 Prokaryotic cytochrome b561 [Afipia felis]